MIRALQGVLVFALAGCAGGGKNAKDSTDGNKNGPEKGCILVDGGGEYKYLQDAVNEAVSGATIELCDDPINESVVVPTNLEIVGTGKTIWNDPDREATGDDDDAALLVKNVKVHISGVTFKNSVIHAMHVQGKTGQLTIQDVEVDGAGAWGVLAEGATLDATNLTVRGAQWGGVSASGDAKVTIEASRFEDVVVYGVGLDDGATADISDTLFQRVADTSDDLSLLTYSSGTPVTDGGYGIFIDDANGGGASATSTNNQFIECEGGAAIVRDATFTSTGDEVIGGVAAFAFDSAEGEITDISATNYWQFGIFSFASDITVDGGEFTTDPTDSMVWAPANQGGTPGAIGLLGFDTDASLANLKISGHNGGGVILADAFQTDKRTVVFDTIELADNAIYGASFDLASVTANDVDVHGTLSNERACYNASQNSYSCNFALRIVDSDFTLDTGSVLDNDGFGLIAFDGSVVIDDIEVARNTYGGLQVYGGALNLSNAELHAAGESGLRLDRGASGTLDLVSFHDNITNLDTTSVNTNGDTIQTIRYGAGVDMWVRDATATITNSTFRDGNHAVLGYNAVLDISDSGFTNYTGSLWYSPNGIIGNNVVNTGSTTLARITMDQIGSYAIDADGGTLQAQQIAISNVIGTPYRYEQYTNGTLTIDTTSTIDGPAIYAYESAINLDRINVNNASRRGLYTRESSVTVSDSRFTATNPTISSYAAVELDYSTTTPDVSLSEVVVETTLGHGIYIDGTNTTGGLVSLRGVEVGDPNATTLPDIGQNGVYLTNLASVQIEGIAVANTGADAIRASGVVADIAGDDSISGFTGGLTGGVTGVRIEGASDVTLTDLGISSPTGDGVHVSGSSILATSNVTIDATGESGLYLDGNGTTGHDLNTTTVTNATEYGMECLNDPAFATCDTTVAGTLGDRLDCTQCIP